MSNVCKKNRRWQVFMSVFVCEVSGEVNLVLMETTPEHSRTKKQAKPSKKPPAGEP
jgi:hypothetical protein